MQNYHSLLYREEEREMNPVCAVSKQPFYSLGLKFTAASISGWVQSHGHLSPVGFSPARAMVQSAH